MEKFVNSSFDHDNIKIHKYAEIFVPLKFISIDIEFKSFSRDVRVIVLFSVY